MSNMKICSKCGELKPEAAYRKYRHGCRTCESLTFHQLWQQWKDNMNKLLGTECYFSSLGGCNFRIKDSNELQAHEKSGNGHEKRAIRILRDEPDRAPEFVNLCYRHHSCVHGAMDIGFTWDEIEAQLLRIANYLEPGSDGS